MDNAKQCNISSAVMSQQAGLLRPNSKYFRGVNKVIMAGDHQERQPGD